MSTVEQPLLNLVAEHLGVERGKMTLDSTLKSLGVDSLDAVDLILTIENRFSVHIPDEETANLDTPRKMIAYLDAHTGEG